jgi:hypothetical protein
MEDFSGQGRDCARKGDGRWKEGDNGRWVVIWGGLYGKGEDGKASVEGSGMMSWEMNLMWILMRELEFR